MKNSIFAISFIVFGLAFATSSSSANTKAHPKSRAAQAPPQKDGVRKTTSKGAGVKDKSITSATTKSLATKEKPVLPSFGAPLAFKVLVYPEGGNIQIGSMTAGMISSKTVAAKCDLPLTIQDVISDAKFSIATSSEPNNLRVTDLDLKTGTVFLEAGRPLPNTVNRDLAVQLAKAFGLTKASDWSQGWSELKARFIKRRHLASTLQSKELLARELKRLEDEKIASLADRKEIILEGQKIAPLFGNLKCKPSAVRVESPKLQRSFLRATELSCSEDEIMGSKFALTAGVLYLAESLSGPSARSMDLIDQITQAQFESHKLMASDVDKSTPVVCHKNRIGSTQFEIHYCTRGLRIAPSFSDTVIAVARIEGERLYYSVLRTGAMTSGGTMQVVSTLMSTMGAKQ